MADEQFPSAWAVLAVISTANILIKPLRVYRNVRGHIPEVNPERLGW